MAKKRKTVPKSVVGVSIPKTLRNSSLVSWLFENPLGRQILADALVAAAGAAAAALVKHRPSGEEIARGGQTVANAASAAAATGTGLARSALDGIGELLATPKQEEADRTDDELSAKARRRRAKSGNKARADHPS